VVVRHGAKVKAEFEITLDHDRRTTRVVPYGGPRTFRQSASTFSES
jgi:hypothetical protein